MTKKKIEKKKEWADMVKATIIFSKSKYKNIFLRSIFNSTFWTDYFYVLCFQNYQQIRKVASLIKNAEWFYNNEVERDVNG